MKKVLTYGTYDLIHPGHINLLRRARDFGDYLIVALSTDEFSRAKNKKTFHSFEDRKMILESISYVDLVIPEYSWDQKVNDVLEYEIEIFTIGDDWEGKFDFLKEYCSVIYLSRTRNISTTQIKEILRNR